MFSKKSVDYFTNMDIACIFDWDGTVVDSGRTHEFTWRELARRHGLELFPNFFEKTFGTRNLDIITKMLNWTADPREAQALSDEKERLYREIVLERGVPQISGIENFLAELNRAGVKCAVGSSTPMKNLDVTVEKLGFGKYFQAYAASEDVSRGKPAPDVFLVAAEKLGVSPANCLVFEDSVAGIKAGVAAGMKTAAVCTTHPADFWLAARSNSATKTDIIINDFTEISPDAVSALFGAGN